MATSTWSATHPKTQTGSRGIGNLYRAATKEKCTRLRVESSSFEDVADETLKTDLYDAAASVISARFSQSAGVSGCECSHCTGSAFMLAVKPNTFRSDFLRLPPPPSTDVPTALCKAFSASFFFATASFFDRREARLVNLAVCLRGGWMVTSSKKEREKKNPLKRLLTAAHSCQTGKTLHIRVSARIMKCVVNMRNDKVSAMF